MEIIVQYQQSHIEQINLLSKIISAVPPMNCQRNAIDEFLEKMHLVDNHKELAAAVIQAGSVEILEDYLAEHGPSGITTPEGWLTNETHNMLRNATDEFAAIFMSKVLEAFIPTPNNQSRLGYLLASSIGDKRPRSVAALMSVASAIKMSMGPLLDSIIFLSSCSKELDEDTAMTVAGIIRDAGIESDAVLNLNAKLHSSHIGLWLTLRQLGVPRHCDRPFYQSLYQTSHQLVEATRGFSFIGEPLLYGEAECLRRTVPD